MMPFGAQAQALDDLIRCILDGEVNRHGSELAPKQMPYYHDCQPKARQICATAKRGESEPLSH
jgi:hypothetical protein